ncbi:MAG: STAS domain-containing protein [Acidimicrobiales bacterium]
MTSWIFPASAGDVDGQPVPADFLSITLEMRGASTVVVLDGVVCAYTSPHLDAELHKIEALDRHRLVVDAHSVRTLSSDGLAVLVDHAERCTTAGGELVIREPSPVTRRVLSACDLERLIEPSIR